MIVLGIDPGTATTGFGVVAEAPAPPSARQSERRANMATRPRLIECGVIRTRARAPLATRLQDIYEGIVSLIERHHPDILAVEDVFYARNVRTTLTLGHARGVVLLAGVEAGLAIREYAPAEIKKAVVGTGSATKAQVQYMLTQLLRLRSAPQPADAADGVAAALTCLLTAHLERVNGHGPAASRRDDTARRLRSASAADG